MTTRRPSRNALPDDLRLPLDQARRALRSALKVDVDFDRPGLEAAECRELLAGDIRDLKAAIDAFEVRSRSHPTTYEGD